MNLNCDMGELTTGQIGNFDHEIMPFISSCNIACGFHSGTPAIIDRTIRLALQHDVHIGAHPSYNDRAHFGRVSVDTDISTLISEWRYQICAVKGMVESMGGQLHHVKPHGALYNDMVENDALATTFVRVVKSIDPSLKIYALAQSTMIGVCNSEGIPVINEGFADRRYEQLQQLRNRSLDGAVIHDAEEVLEQVDNFIQGRVQLYSGEMAEIHVESICLHSDTAGAVHLSQQIHHFLKNKNIAIS